MNWHIGVVKRFTIPPVKTADFAPRTYAADIRLASTTGLDDKDVAVDFQHIMDVLEPLIRPLEEGESGTSAGQLVPYLVAGFRQRWRRPGRLIRVCITNTDDPADSSTWRRNGEASPATPARGDTMIGRFRARHCLTRNGRAVEPLHEHRYIVRVSVERSSREGGRPHPIPASGLAEAVTRVVQELDGTVLNELPYFRRHSPSTERIAGYVFERLQAWDPVLPPIQFIQVWESEERYVILQPRPRPESS